MASRATPLSQKLRLAVLVLAVLGGAYAVWGDRKTEEVPDLTGVWTITNTVNDSNYKRYLGETFEFRINVIQDGTTLTGEGEQTLYNGKTARHHYPIAFTDAVIHADEIVLRYKMQGSRETTGIFTLRPSADDAGLLNGTFTSTAADTKGTTVVRIARP